MAEVASKQVTLRGVDVRYVELGAGPPLVLIHGFLVSHREWARVLPLLARRFRCIALDLPGYGESARPSPESYPYTREAFAETVSDLLHALEIGSAFVCGHSLGGAIASTLAADFPERVARLAMIDCACFGMPTSFKARLPLVPGIGSILFKKLYRRGLFRDYFRTDVFNNGPGYVEADVDAYYEDFQPRPSRDAAYATMRRSLETLAELTPKLARIRAPTLLVWGADDAIFPVSTAHRLVRELPRARLEILPGVGHAPNEERSAEVEELLVAHFADAPS